MSKSERYPMSRAVKVLLNDESLTVHLADGRVISVPLVWYPRLSHGDVNEKGNWRLIDQGRGIRWPDLDEDISVDNLFSGRPSAESQSSLKQWLARRSAS